MPIKFLQMLVRGAVPLTTVFLSLGLFASCNDDNAEVATVSKRLDISVVNDSVRSRVLIEGEVFPDGSNVGVTLLDLNGEDYSNDCHNILYSTDDGTVWKSTAAPKLTATQGKAVAYFPYDGSFGDYTAIPVTAGDTDYMYSGWVTGLSKSNTKASFVMKHAMTGIRLNIRKSPSYIGDGIMSSLSIKSSSLATSATMNAAEGSFSDVSGTGESMQLISSDRVFEDNTIAIDWLAVPVNGNKDLLIEGVVDGRTYKTSITAEEPFAQGSILIWNLILTEANLVTQSVTAEPWNMEEETDEELLKDNPYLILAYNATSTSSNTTLFSTVSGMKEMIVGGNSVTPATSYKFSLTGEHEVKVRFTDDTQLSNNLCKSVTALTKIKAFPSTLEKINTYSFYGCTGLRTMVRLPEKLKTIETYAFYGCVNLRTNLRIPSSVNTVDYFAFRECNNILSLVVEPVNCLKGGSFYGCKGLQKVHLPEGFSNLPSQNVSSTTYGVFQECTGLKAINLPESMTSIGNNAFCGCTGLTGTLTIPEGVTSIGNTAFYNCSGLSNITIPNSVTSIGASAFKGCTRLTEVTIPERVRSIGTYAFQNCTGITEVTIPKSISNINDYTFDGCSKLQSLVISEGVTNIGQYAFQNCTGLKSIVIPESVTSIGARAFSGCTGITGKLDIPKSVTTIGGYAFYQCRQLTEVDIPESVTSIGTYAFMDCRNLLKITVHENNTVFDSRNNCNAIIRKQDNVLLSGCHNTIIPDNIECIESHALYYYTGITEITIPESVTSIGDYAFAYCSGLITILSEATTAPTIYSKTFFNVNSGGTLTIPEGSYDSYSAWMATTNNYLGSLGWKCREKGGSVDGIFYSNDGKTALSADEGYTGTFIIREGTESIADGAFRNCTFIEDILIENGVTSIGHYAFSGCAGLTGKLVIPNSVTSIGDYAFDGCTGLTELHFGDEVQTIGGYAFKGCTGITGTLTIPEAVTTIGTYAFNNCASIGAVKVLGNVSSLQSHTFSGMSNLEVVELPASLTSISNYTFQDDSKLVRIICNATVAPTLYQYSFEDVSLKGTLTVPVGSYSNYSTWMQDKSYYLGSKQWTCIENSPSINGVFYTQDGKIALKADEEHTGPYIIKEGTESIASFAFRNKIYIKDVVIEEGLTSIPERAFNECTGLESVTIPKSVTSIGNYAFYYCSKLSKVKSLATNAPTISSNVFYSCSYNGLLVVPEGYTANYSSWMGTGSYYLGYLKWKIVDDVEPVDGVYYSTDGTAALAADPSYEGNIVIRNGTKKISKNAFYGCTSITGELTIPEGVTTIEENAFYGCNNIQKLVLPATLTSIANYAFQGCNKLQLIESYAQTAATVKQYTFNGVCSNGVLKVPSGKTSAYSSWRSSSSYYLGYYSWTIVEM